MKYIYQSLKVLNCHSRNLNASILIVINKGRNIISEEIFHDYLKDDEFFFYRI